MANEEIYNGDEFIITLTLPDRTEIEANVTNPSLTIQDQINKIVENLKLPKADTTGAPLSYLLGWTNTASKSEILDFKDDEGREQCFYDCVKPGDHLYLIAIPIAG